MFRKVLLFATLCILNSTFIIAQLSNNVLEKLYEDFSKRDTLDMVYIQTDKEIYETGEDLWFKAYLLDVTTLAVSDRSNTLYLQMLTEQDSVVWQECYPIQNGISSGQVYIDINLQEGKYTLEAYTRYSFLNDSTTQFPSKEIRIVNHLENEIHDIRLDTLEKVPILANNTIDSSEVLFFIKELNDSIIEFNLKSTTSSNQEENIYLVGTMRGNVYCIASGIIKDTLTIKIPLEHFQYRGIAKFVLLDNSFNQIAEQSIYLHPQKKIDIRITSDKVIYKQREKVALRIKTFDKDKKPIKSHIGISVSTKNNYNPHHRIDDIAISSLGNETLSYGTPFLTDDIIGHLQSKLKNANEQLIQLTNTEGKSTYIWTDTKGTFKISSAVLKQNHGGYLYLKPMLEKKYKPRISFINYFTKINEVKKKKKNLHTTHWLKFEKTVDDFNPNFIDDGSTLLNEVVVKAKKKPLKRDKYLGHLDSLAKNMFSTAFVCGCGYLQNYVEGYNVHPWKHSCGEISAPVDGKVYPIIKVKVHEVKGSIGSFSVIDRAYITYEAPKFTEEYILNKFNISTTKGYYGNRSFFSPSDTEIQQEASDYRNTLYWNPNVITDKNGEALVEFYASDVTGEFVVTVECTNLWGGLGSALHNFIVTQQNN